MSAYFRDVLGVAAISPAADFFDLGVTSLNLIQIAERLHEEHGLDVAVETFLDHPSIAALAAGIGVQLPAPAGAPPAAGQQPVQAPCFPQQAPAARMDCAGLCFVRHGGCSGYAQKNTDSAACGGLYRQELFSTRLQRGCGSCSPAAG